MRVARGIMRDDALGDLPTAELREQGARLLAWIAEYLDHPERHHVVSPLAPGDVRRSLPQAPPPSTPPPNTPSFTMSIRTRFSSRRTPTS